LEGKVSGPPRNKCRRIKVGYKKRKTTRVEKTWGSRTKKAVGVPAPSLKHGKKSLIGERLIRVQRGQGEWRSGIRTTVPVSKETI